MTAHQQHQRLARLSLIGELWKTLEAEEAAAKKSRKAPNWRTILKTQAMREDAATTVFGKEPK
jgi:hypothetical protein